MFSLIPVPVIHSSPYQVYQLVALYLVTIGFLILVEICYRQVRH